ncbi:4-galactosyl-N-acetylglucosaminide 3-alpha-L-fucosyltransferase 9-like isoform X1 [Gasterosteus aculeatus]
MLSADQQHGEPCPVQPPSGLLSVQFSSAAFWRFASSSFSSRTRPTSPTPILEELVSFVLPSCVQREHRAMTQSPATPQSSSIKHIQVRPRSSRRQQWTLSPTQLCWSGCGQTSTTLSTTLPCGFRFELNCDIFNFTRCHLTDNRELYHKAHGVVFHHRDIHGSLENMPKGPRPVFQKWVWSNMESPTNSGKITGLNELFNLTCNYRRDSSIPVPYGYLYPVTSAEESFKLPAKDKLVCWIVSNWSPNMKRVQYYNELKKHVTIHAYGRAFEKPIGNEDFVKMISACKFYLSFENSFHRDYITEKFFNPLTWGSVPVVMGPPRHTYEGHAPAESFIHVDDFPSPKELAERLLYLDQNHTEYMRFFNWRSAFKVKGALFGREIACKTCIYLQNHKEYQAFNDLNTWYWG